ncbi:thioredoxin family protein [Denitratisoma sp. DHT3]|uniref:glutaredoxin family protein n=1 Tax=Denitratisoma sp. DHT3 TaxID=1981880 RepID=UPI0011985DB3|nr:glutaredoxin family protein [Denitratisoma sp. DHT3]QDX80416.1 thioredoxin family protein [Denitratisoma sp. DHT3]
MSPSKPLLTLYGRTYCHLCDDMLAALQPLRDQHPFEVRVVDVDADPALEARYDERVPVLEGGGRELCHYFLDEAKVREYLASFR